MKDVKSRLTRENGLSITSDLRTTMMIKAKMKTARARKLASMLLVAVAISVFAATPAHADGTDAATGVVCDAAYYFDFSYYVDYCAQFSP